MAQLIPAHTQLLAVAWLRWRMFVNSFQRRRSDRKAAAIVVAILLRVIVWPIVALIAVGPVVGCGFAAWNAIARHQPDTLLPLLTTVFLLWQYLSINGIALAATTSSFDPSSLLRFPIPFGRYLVLRTLFGLLTPTTIIGCLCLLSATLGIAVANHALALVAALALALYALTNIFFTRMIGAWVERWMANRRAKEIFSALTILLIVGFQFFNLRIVPAHRGLSKDDGLMQFLHRAGQVLIWLPPGFASQSILTARQPLSVAMYLGGLLAWVALFLAVFAIRLHKQYLGEYLSESVPASRPTKPVSRPEHFSTHRPLLPRVIGACLLKEWIYFRGNTTQLIAMLTPLLFIFILSRSLFATFPNFFLPGAIAYSLLGFLTGLYNIFGADGSGVQLYLLAPVRLRDVILAKNIASLIPIVIEVVLAWCVVLALNKTPIAIAVQSSVFFWAGFVVFINLTVGTLRSIQAPRKFVPGQTRQTRVPTNRNSSLLVLALFFGSILLVIPVSLLSSHFAQPWLAALIFAPLAGMAISGYVLLLGRVERLIDKYRDLLAEELCKG